MNEKLEKEISALLADFEEKQKAIITESDNLKKSTDAIKQTVLREYETVEKSLLEDLKSLSDLLRKLTVRNLDNQSDYFNSCDDQWRSVFYVFTASSWSTFFRLRINTYLDSCGFEVAQAGNDTKYFYYNKDGLQLKMHDYLYSLKDFDKETVVYFYKNIFIGQAIEIVKKMIEKNLSYYSDILEGQKRILKNATPVVQNDSHWSEYIMYLLKWSSEHADNSFSGMSPACYDEWLDNEFEDKE